MWPDFFFFFFSLSESRVGESCDIICLTEDRLWKNVSSSLNSMSESAASTASQHAVYILGLLGDNVFQAAAQLSEQVGVCCRSAGHATVDAQAAAAMESAPSPQCDHPKLQGKRGCGDGGGPLSVEECVDFVRPPCLVHFSFLPEL